MVRGHAKAEAQQKNAKKLADAKGGKSLKEIEKAREAGNAIICPKCLVGMPSYKIFSQHFESKHSGPVPDEGKFR
ncbi:hypothetical protein HK099_004393 [Clydaea vesicula]|uniref:C2H2-type domain-containing protein n=1 Tax=Clydaea vesicula TaxID=447962 RepID=A0AAD5U0T6_9FUNG|nr:hypothetical protein HK099_004393 [Clydaea vesicula]KAJ3380174.1 hypothetical protein HDU92_006144 [Lobulomyces angularis]